jgi:hypothetical protein
MVSSVSSEKTCDGSGRFHMCIPFSSPRNPGYRSTATLAILFSVSAAFLTARNASHVLLCYYSFPLHWLEDWISRKRILHVKTCGGVSGDF